MTLRLIVPAAESGTRTETEALAAAFETHMERRRTLGAALKAFGIHTHQTPVDILEAYAEDHADLSVRELVSGYLEAQASAYETAVSHSKAHRRAERRA